MLIRNYVATIVHIISVSHLKTTELQAKFSLQMTQRCFYTTWPFIAKA